MTAIERITGFACEVNEEQWRELVRVADELGCPVGKDSRVRNGVTEKFACVHTFHRVLGRYYTFGERNLIPYPDFLAKLKGDEKWEPKAGDMVELSYNGTTFTEAIEYIAYRDGHHWAWRNDEAKRFRFVRPLGPTITRKEAEEKLNARIID